MRADWQSVPERLRKEVEQELASNEQRLAWFCTDLDPQLHFADGVVVCTDRRVLAAGAAAEGSKSRGCSAWPLNELTGVQPVERLGYGVLELHGRTELLARWHFTSTNAANAAKFVARLEDIRSGRHAAAAADNEQVCPSCGSRFPQGDKQCPVCKTAPAPPPVRSLWRISRFARPRAGLLALGILLTLAGTASSLIPPYLTIPLINDVLIPIQAGQQVDLTLIPWCLGGMFGAAVLAWALGWGKVFVLAKLGERVSADIRNATYDHLQRLSLDFFGTKRTGDLISRISNDTERLCNFIAISLADFSTDVVMIVLTTAALLSINPAMAVVTLLPFPFIAWMIQVVRLRLRRGFARSSFAWAEMVNVLADTIPGIRVVKAFAQEQREMARFRRRNRHVLDANDRVNRLWSFFGPTITLLTDCGLLVIWAFGAWSVVNGDITVGVLTAFVAYIGRLYTRLDSMSRMVVSVQRAAAATHRIFEILDRVPSVAEPVNPVHPGRVEGKIELRHMSFKYGNRQVLTNLNLTIEPGEMIGLVGPSGAGKSTVANLVCRFYDVSSGTILIDDVDVRSFPVEEYRRNIGVVLQEPYLFFGTIAENIAYARPEASRDQIIAAARAGRAHDFILKLPDGYDSMVGERGQSLSGGERQRISIARALLTDPRILILDEATSSVDTETEREIQAALENLISGRTTIAIAHRLSTLRRADRIVVLEDGHITDVGTHVELMERSATYARLNQAQQLAAATSASSVQGEGVAL
jgi:ATP-binding cassette subfamily B protein